MSQGNACAAIGLANTSKVPMIGGYKQDVDAPVGGADGPYVGTNGSTYWDRDWLGEDYAASGGYVVPATTGAAAGKTARWVSTGGASMTVAADGRCSVSVVGVITATATTGLYKIYLTPGAVIPAGSFLWAFLV